MRRGVGWGYFTTNSQGCSLATTYLNMPVCLHLRSHTQKLRLCLNFTRGAQYCNSPHQPDALYVLCVDMAHLPYCSLCPTPSPLTGPCALNSQGVSDGQVPGSSQVEGCALKSLPKCEISLSVTIILVSMIICSLLFMLFITLA